MSLKRNSPEVITYNTNKKLAQLNKVTCFMKGNIAETLTQIEFINEAYDTEFKQLIDTYSEQVEKYNKENMKLRDSLVERLDEMYKSIFEEYKEKYKGKLTKIENHLSVETGKIESEMMKIVEMLKKINLQINEKVDILTKQMPEGENIGQHIKKLKETYANELKQHDDQSEKKYKEFEIQTKEKFVKFDTDYQKSVLNLKKQFLASSKPDPEQERILKGMRDEIITMKEMIKELKNEMSAAQTIVVSNFIGFRGRSDSLMEQYNELHTKYLNEENELKAHLNDLCEKIKIENKEQRAEEENENRRHENEVIKLQNQLKMLKAHNNEEREKKEKWYLSTTELSNEEYEELQKHLQNDLDELIMANEESEKSNQWRVDEYINKMDDIDKKNIAKYDELELSLRNTIDKNQKDIDDLQKELEEEKSQLLEKYKDEIDIFYHAIEDRSSIVRDYDLANKEKEELEELIEILKAKNQKEIEDFDQNLKEETEKLIEENLNNKDLLDKELNDDLEKYQTESNDSISSTAESRKEAKQKRIDELENEFQNHMEQIKQEFIGQNVSGQLEETYNNEYQKLEEQMESLSEIRLVSDDHSVDEVREKKIKLINDVDEERKKILDEWNQHINEEKDRYQKHLLAFLPSEEDTRLTDLREEGLKKISEYDKRIDELSSLFSSAQSSSSRMMIDGFLEDEEVIKLRKELERVTEECKNARREAQKKLETDVQQSKENNEKEKENQEESLKFEQKKQELIILANASKLASQNNQLSENIDIHKQEYSDALDECGKSRIDFARKIEEHKEQLRKVIDYEVENLSIINKAIFKEMKKYIDDYNELSAKNIKNWEAEIEKITQAKDEFLTRLDDHVKVAEEREKQAEKRYIERDMRPEEKAEIDRLTNILESKTKHLMTIAKDHKFYKNHLLQQEDEVNQRFGTTPSVALCTRNNNNNLRKPKSVLARTPLPPLGESVAI